MIYPYTAMPDKTGALRNTMPPKMNTARPRGTLPHETLTLMGHCFEMGPKILRYTVLHCYLQHIIKM